MKIVHSMIAVAVLALTLPAQAAVGDPEVILYRGSGLADNGPGGSTVTTISCTPFSGVNENIRVVVRNLTGDIVANKAGVTSHLNTAVFSTSDTAIYLDINMATGAFPGGTVAIAATSTSVACTAMLIQPNNTAPVGVQLHMIRFNPLPGTAE
jgi:hypothetical protein